MNLDTLWKEMFEGIKQFFGNIGTRAALIHETKTGPGRSKGMKRKQHVSGVKIARKAFEGMCTLRSGVGAAGRLALEGKLTEK